MTTCPYCLDRMAATSERQRGIREANLVTYPEITIAPCPQCGGVEWATTNARVSPDSVPISNRLPSSVQILTMVLLGGSVIMTFSGIVALVLWSVR